jgi:hypothetical protein
VGSRIKFKLIRPYTEEEEKIGYDNKVNGRTGTIICIHNGKNVEVRLDKPLMWEQQKCYNYIDTTDNMKLL